MDFLLLILSFPPLAVAAPLYGGIAAGLGSLFGAKQASSSAKEINAQQIALSREQMKFQERMSNTAFQRSTKDLEAAGLNRILALGSPSSSPGGAQPPSLKVPGEYIQRGISSALQNANVGAQIALTNAQTRKAENEADITGPEAAIKGELLQILELIIPHAKEIGGDVLTSAKQAATGLVERIDTKIGTIRGEPARKEQSQLTYLEQTYSPRMNESQNLAAFAAAYKRHKNYPPSVEVLRRAGAEIRAMRKRNKR